MSLLPHTRQSAQATTLIVVACAAFGIFVEWQAPGLDRYSRDWLTRLRGPVPVSNEIALVAIDDAAIAKYGRFPWPRTVLARAIDAIAAEQPKAIALDILITDSTTPSDDQALADAVGRARNVVAAAQLAERSPFAGEAIWLNPLPALAGRAAAVGHIGVGIESDGTARDLLLEQSDDAGKIIRALPLETYRIGNRIPADTIVRGLNELTVGSESIPLVGGSAQMRRASRMAIDYAGPSGAFASRQAGIADLLEGRLPPGTLRGRYVLVGATAASLGERFASPFTHYSEAQGNQHGAPLSGLEVLANALNTLVRGRFYRPMPDAAAFAFTALAAWLALGLLSIAPGRRGLLRHTAALLAGLALLIAAAYLCYSQWLLFPPLVGALVSFGSAGISGLAARSASASAGLDRGIHRVAESLRGLGETPSPNAMAESIVRLAGVSGALLLKSGKVLGAYGFPGPKPVGIPDRSRLPDGMLTTNLTLGEDGVLVLAHPWSSPPVGQSLHVAEALGLASLRTFEAPLEAPSGLLPEGVEAKSRRIVALNERIARQAEFFHSAMRAVQDGLLIAGADGLIRFANARAGAILDSSPEALIGQELADVLALPEAADREALAALIGNLILHRHTFERELVFGARRYTLRMAAVADSPDSAIGIVASLADITRQHELAQTRNDVVTLVSHEMRTPLTAIQGMTELLAAYDIEPVRRREMTLAINDEVKRLARMIGDYLDIARLEMGKTQLRRAPLRLEFLVERNLLLFEPVAHEKAIRLLRRFDSELPPLLADADLLSRVFGNLISNAVKYSPAGTDVTVSIHGSMKPGPSRIAVEIEDRGYGIPEEDRERIFEKFYRVPRLQDTDVPGTGLGLAFVREIVELHGGEVTVQSAPGEGSVFTVFLPCEPGFGVSGR